MPVMLAIVVSIALVTGREAATAIGCRRHKLG
jgi:hypothetical protein